MSRSIPMNLFHCADAKRDVIPSPAALQTPLGVVRLDATLDGINVAEKPPSQTYRLPSDGWVACWNRPGFDLELLVCRPVTAPPLGMPLTDCWAALWRLRARSTIASSTFAAIWEEGYAWTQGGPNSGQGLYARTWDDGQTEASIGTDDSKGLAHRARCADGLPSGWEPYFRSTANSFDWFSLEMVHYEVGDRGVPLPLPPLAAGQQCQTHFAIAWSPCAVGEAGGRYTVEVNAGQILAGAGCF